MVRNSGMFSLMNIWCAQGFHSFCEILDLDVSTNAFILQLQFIRVPNLVFAFGFYAHLILHIKDRFTTFNTFNYHCTFCGLEMRINDISNSAQLECASCLIL